MSSSNKMKFKEGDLVFAKVKKWPFWPARINPLPNYITVPKDNYAIFFYGTHEMDFVPEINVITYEDNKERYCKHPTKYKFLTRAMKEIETNPKILMLGEDTEAEDFICEGYGIVKPHIDDSNSDTKSKEVVNIDSSKEDVEYVVIDDDSDESVKINNSHVAVAAVVPVSKSSIPNSIVRLDLEDVIVPENDNYAQMKIAAVMSNCRVVLNMMSKEEIKRYIGHRSVERKLFNNEKVERSKRNIRYKTRLTRTKTKESTRILNAKAQLINDSSDESVKVKEICDQSSSFIKIVLDLDDKNKTVKNRKTKLLVLDDDDDDDNELLNETETVTKEVKPGKSVSVMTKKSDEIKTSKKRKKINDDSENVSLGGKKLKQSTKNENVEEKDGKEPEDRKISTTDLKGGKRVMCTINKLVPVRVIDSVIVIDSDESQCSSPTKLDKSKSKQQQSTDDCTSSNVKTKDDILTNLRKKLKNKEKTKVKTMTIPSNCTESAKNQDWIKNNSVRDGKMTFENMFTKKVDIFSSGLKICKKTRHVTENSVDDNQDNGKTKSIKDGKWNENDGMDDRWEAALGGGGGDDDDDEPEKKRSSEGRSVNVFLEGIKETNDDDDDEGAWYKGNEDVPDDYTPADESTDVNKNSMHKGVSEENKECNELAATEKCNTENKEIEGDNGVDDVGTRYLMNKGNDNENKAEGSLKDDENYNKTGDCKNDNENVTNAGKLGNGENYNNAGNRENDEENDSDNGKWGNNDNSENDNDTGKWGDNDESDNKAGKWGNNNENDNDTGKWGNDDDNENNTGKWGNDDDNENNTGKWGNDDENGNKAVKSGNDDGNDNNSGKWGNDDEEENSVGGAWSRKDEYNKDGGSGNKSNNWDNGNSWNKENDRDEEWRSENRRNGYGRRGRSRGSSRGSRNFSRDDRNDEDDGRSFNRNNNYNERGRGRGRGRGGEGRGGEVRSSLTAKDIGDSEISYAEWRKKNSRNVVNEDGDGATLLAQLNENLNNSNEDGNNTEDGGNEFEWQLKDGRDLLDALATNDPRRGGGSQNVITVNEDTAEDLGGGELDELDDDGINVVVCNDNAYQRHQREPRRWYHKDLENPFIGDEDAIMVLPFPGIADNDEQRNNEKNVGDRWFHNKPKVVTSPAADGMGSATEPIRVTSPEIELLESWVDVVNPTAPVRKRPTVTNSSTSRSEYILPPQKDSRYNPRLNQYFASPPKNGLSNSNINNSYGERWSPVKGSWKNLMQRNIQQQQRQQHQQGMDINFGEQYPYYEEYPYDDGTFGGIEGYPEMGFYGPYDEEMAAEYDYWCNGDYMGAECWDMNDYSGGMMPVPTDAVMMDDFYNSRYYSTKAPYFNIPNCPWNRVQTDPKKADAPPYFNISNCPWNRAETVSGKSIRAAPPALTTEHIPATPASPEPAAKFH